MDVVVLAIASIVWGAVLVGAAYGLQHVGSLRGAARQALWRIAAILLVAPWIAAPLADLAGIGLPAPAPERPPIVTTFEETVFVDTFPSAEPAVAVAPSPAAPAQPLPWQAILIGVIAAGWACRFIAARMAALSLKRIVAKSAEAGPGPARESLVAWSRRLHLKTTPSLRVVEEGLSPFSFGIVRSVICLPEGLDRKLDREALDLVVAHECLHTARGDGWLRPAERFAADLVWFNPFAWRIRRELDVARELACDEAVLKHVHAHRAYAHTLRNVASIAAGLGSAVPATSMSLSGSPRSLMLRIKQALNGAKAKPARTAIVGVAIFGVAGTLAACVQGIAAAPRVAPPAKTAAPMAPILVTSVAPEQTPPAPIEQLNAPPTIETVSAPRAQSGLRFDRKTSPILNVPAGIAVGGIFGYRADPFTGKTAFHTGLDLKAGWGEAIHAPVDGIVSFAGSSGSYGRVVELDLGDGVAMRFGHLNTIVVEKDGVVKAGQKIGTVGSTGRSTGPHVHVEYLRDGKNYDPREVENLVFAKSVEIDLRATEPAPPIDPTTVTPDAPPATVAPDALPLLQQNPAPPAPVREIKAWWPGRVTIAEPGRNGGFKVKVEQTADTATNAGCSVEMDRLVDMKVTVGRELKVGDLIGSGAWGRIEFGESCRRSNNAALDAIFPERLAKEERRFASGGPSSILRSGFNPSLPGREIKAWYPAKVALVDGSAEGGYKVRLVQTENTASVRECTVGLSKMKSVRVAVGQVLAEGDVIGQGSPENMDFRTTCRETTDAQGRSPMLNAFPELRNQRQDFGPPEPVVGGLVSLGSQTRGPGPIPAPFDARVTKVERLGDLYAVDLEATGAVTRGPTGEGCSTRMVGLASVSVKQGDVVKENAPVGVQPALEGFDIRCRSVGPAPQPTSAPAAPGSSQGSLTPIVMRQETPAPQTPRAVSRPPIAELEARLTIAKTALARGKTRFQAGAITRTHLWDLEDAVGIAQAGIEDAKAGSEPGKGVASAELQLQVAVRRAEEGKRLFDQGAMSQEVLSNREATVAIARARLADLRPVAN